MTDAECVLRALEWAHGQVYNVRTDEIVVDAKEALTRIIERMTPKPDAA